MNTGYMSCKCKSQCLCLCMPSISDATHGIFTVMWNERPYCNYSAQFSGLVSLKEKQENCARCVCVSVSLCFWYWWWWQRINVYTRKAALTWISRLTRLIWTYISNNWPAVSSQTAQYYKGVCHLQMNNEDISLKPNLVLEINVRHHHSEEFFLQSQTCVKSSTSPCSLSCCYKCGPVIRCHHCNKSAGEMSSILDRNQL